MFCQRSLSKNPCLTRIDLIHLLVFDIFHQDSGWSLCLSLKAPFLHTPELSRTWWGRWHPGADTCYQSPVPSFSADYQQYLVPELVGKGKKREKNWEKWTRWLRSKEWQMKLKIVPSAVVKEIRLTGGCFFCQEWFVLQETIPTPALLILVVSLTDKKEQGLTSLEPHPVLTFVCFHACACFKRQPRD